MRFIDSVRRAGRSLRHAKVRTILTSLAIAVGAFTLTLSLAVGEGARRYANQLITNNIDPQSIMVAKDAAMFGGTINGGGLQEYSESSTELGGMKVKGLSLKDIESVKQIAGIEKVTPMYMVTAKYVTFEGNDKKFTSEIGMYDSGVKVDAAAGLLPELGKQIGDNDVVIPQAYAESLKLKPQEMIGKKVTVSLSRSANQPSEEEVRNILATEGFAGLTKLAATESKEVSFKVVAVSAQSSTTFSASNGLFISENQARQLSEYINQGTDNYQTYWGASAYVKDGQNPEAVKKDIESKGLIAKTAKDMQNMIFQIVNILQGIVAGFGVLALIASVFGIINTQYISVLERTREIGLMKALGMRRSHVSRLFQLEAAWIGFLGGVIGSGIGILLGTALNPWISEKLGIGDIRLLIYVPIQIALLLIGLILVGMAAGLVPARKAAKLDPIEALRTE